MGKRGHPFGLRADIWPDKINIVINFDAFTFKLQNSLVSTGTAGYFYLWHHRRAYVSLHALNGAANNWDVCSRCRSADWTRIMPLLYTHAIKPLSYVTGQGEQLSCEIFQLINSRFPIRSLETGRRVRYVRNNNLAYLRLGFISMYGQGLPNNDTYLSMVFFYYLVHSSV